MTEHKHPLLCAVELSSLRLWLIVFLRKNRLSISVSSRTCQAISTTVGSPPTVQSYIDGSCQEEWKKYEDFQAAIPLKGKELSDLLEAGHVPIPSKWVDTIKNVHEKHKPDYVPEFKSS